MDDSCYCGYYDKCDVCIKNKESRNFVQDAIEYLNEPREEWMQKLYDTYGAKEKKSKLVLINGGKK